MNISQREREYFVSKVGGAEPTEPLNNVKMRYFGSLDLPGRTVVEKEKAWLRKIIRDAGETPVSINQAELWFEAASAVGTVNRTLSNNKLQVFLNT